MLYLAYSGTAFSLFANRFFYPALLPPSLSASCVISRYLRGYFRFSTNRSFLIPFPSLSFDRSYIYLFLFLSLFVSFPTSHIHTALFSHNKREPFACRVPPRESKTPFASRASPWTLPPSLPGLQRDKPPPGIRDCLDLYARIDVGRGRSRFSCTPGGTMMFTHR